MLLRAAALYVLFVMASLAGGIAVWQTFEVRVRDNRIAESLKSEEALQGRLQLAVDASLSAERRARLAENELADLGQSQTAAKGEIDALKAELAAAQQQVSVAETSMTEAEDRLAAEVAAHANLSAQINLSAQKASEPVAASRVSFEPPPSAPIAPPDAGQPTNTVTIGHIEAAVTAPSLGPGESAADVSGPAATVTPLMVKPPPDAVTPVAATNTVTVERPAAAGIEAGAAQSSNKSKKVDDKRSADSNMRKKKPQAKAFTKRAPANKATTQSILGNSLF